RLPLVLGPPALRRRMLSRGAHALRLDHPREPALLRVDPCVDAYLSGGLWRAGRACPARPRTSRKLTETLCRRWGAVKHIKTINGKARRIEAHVAAEALPAESRPHDVVALEGNGPPQPNLPLGCTFLFSPGWETDSTGSTAGLCQPVERDLFDCHLGCFWPAQVPDQLNNAGDWTSKCAAAQKDWRKLDLVFP